jgi:tetratricopeptide (TPR) repeat protein
VAEQWLEEAPLMEEVQRQFLLKALGYYEEFARDRATDPAARRGAASAARRVGDIQRKLHAFAEAERAYGRAIELYASLVSADPPLIEDREALAGCHLALARLLGQVKRRAEAQQTCRVAVELFRQLHDEDPESVSRGCELGVGLSELGLLLQIDGQQKEARKAYQEAVELFRPLPAASPAAAGYDYQLGLTLARLAELEGGWGLKQARSLLERAVAAQRVALAQRPRRAEYRHQLAVTLANLAAVKARLWDPDGAEESYRQSAAVAEPLADDFPRALSYRGELAVTLNDLGDLLFARGRRWDAGRFYERVLEQGNKLAAEPAAAPGVCRDLAWFLATCPEPRFRDAARALTLARRAVELAPRGGDCWRALGAAHCRAEDWAAAAAALEKAVELRSGGDGREWLLLALAHAHLDDKPKAREWYDKARQWLAKAGPEPPALSGLRAEVKAAIGDQP